MLIIKTPDASGVIARPGEMLGQELPAGYRVIDAENITVPDMSAAILTDAGTVEIVPDWCGSGPWYDQDAALSDRETAINITEVGIDPAQHNWAMQPRPLTSTEVKALAKAEAEVKAKAEAEAQANLPAAERERVANLAVSDVQFGLACVGAGIITAKEAESWVAAGVIPANLATAIETLPDDQQVIARIKVAGEKTFARSSPFVAILGAALGMDAEKLDSLFIAASAL